MQTINVVAFGASNSKYSINKEFARFAASQIPNGSVSILDLNDYEMPIFSIEREKEIGFHPLASEFRSKLEAADVIIISFAEYNGSYTGAFKNIFDWISRGGPNIWGNKPMFLLSTSPGKRGGKTVLDTAVNKISRMTTGKIISYSLPEFGKNFVNGIKDKVLRTSFEEQLELLLRHI